MNAFLCLVLFGISYCLADANNHIAYDVNVQEYAAYEKDLVSFNLFRVAGDWILRATTGNANHTRLNINLNQNRVNFRNYHQDKLIGSGVWRHINGSKIVETDFDWKNKREKSKLLVFHQDQKVLVYMIVRPNLNVALKVLVNNCETKTVDNQSIHKLVTQLMANPSIRQLAGSLVSGLQYVNANVPTKDYSADNVTVSQTDAVNWDLTNAVQDVLTLKASSLPGNATQKKCDLIEDNLICNHFNEKGWLGKSTEEYLAGTNVILVKKYYQEQYAQYKKIIAYADDNTIVQLGWPNGQAKLKVWSFGSKLFNAENIKKVIASLRVVKDLAPKLVWK